MLQETWMALLLPNKGMNCKPLLPYQVTFCLSKLLSGLLASVPAGLKIGCLF